MKRVYIKSLYNSAKTSNVPLLFDSTLSSKIPVYRDENGNSVDTDFITYYVQNHDLFDRYIKYMHGSKIYSYDDEEFQTALPAFKDHIEALLFANIDEFAGMFAKETINHKFVLGNKIFKTDTMGEESGTKTYGADSTSYTYGAKHSEATSPQKKTTSNQYNRSYELEALEHVSKSEAISDLFVDQMDEDGYTDSTLRSQRMDSFLNDETINTYETIDNSRYYENMKNIPEFEDCMKRIINKLIIETGASYEY